MINFISIRQVYLLHFKLQRKHVYIRLKMKKKKKRESFLKFWKYFLQKMLF